MYLATCLGRALRRGLGRRLLTGSALLAMAGPAAAAADLVLNNTVDKPSARATEEVVFTITVANNGPDASTGIVLVDTLPATATYVSHTTDVGPACTHSGEAAGGTLTCNIGTLPNQAVATVTLTARITASTPATITNLAAVTADNDDDTSNNALSRNVTITSGTDLEMVLSGSADPVQSGGTLSYTASVVNNGPDAALSPRAVITLAPGFNRTGSLPGGCTQAAQVVTCNAANLASGATWNIGAISGVVAVAGPSSLSTTATASYNNGSGFDGITGNNTAVVNTQVNAGTDVGVSINRSPAGTLVLLDEFQIRLVPTYSGGLPQNLTLSANIDPAFQILGFAATNGWNCGSAGQAVTCTRADGGGANGAYNHAIGRVDIDVRAIASGANLSNTATISAASPNDDNGANDNASLNISVQAPVFDLQALKAGPTHDLRVVDGEAFAYTLRVRNNSNVGFVGQLTMTDTLPAGLRVDSYTLNGWSCSSTDDPLPVAGPATITCTRSYAPGSPLAAGATTPGVLLHTVATAAGAHANQMCVSSAAEPGYSYPADSNAGNDCQSSGITAQLSTASADIAVLKSGDPSVVAGEVLSYSLEIVNSGPASAFDVTLSDLFEDLFTGGSGNGFEGASVAAGNASFGSCTNATPANVGTRNLSCTFTELPVCTQGDNCPVVSVQVRPLANTSNGNDITRNNQACAYSSTTSDPDYGSGNNCGSHSTTVTPMADLSVAKSAAWAESPEPIAAGTNLTYTLTVRNELSGASGSNTVTLTDTLPLDLTFVSASASDGGNCATTPGAGVTTTSANRSLVCSWPSIQRNGQRTVTAVLRPDHGTQGQTLSNLVEVSSVTPEVSLANNSGAVDVPVAIAQADLATTQVDSPDPLQVGDRVTYTLTVTNYGPSVATAVRLYDSLPTSGLSFQGFQHLVGGVPTPGLPAGVSCSSQPAIGAYGAGAVPAAVYAGLNGGWNAALEAADIVCEVSGVMLPNDSVSFQVLLDAEQRGVYTNHLVARSQEHRDGLADPNPANDREPENTTVRIQADVEVVEKTASLATVAVLLPFDYSVVVRNNGPNEALGVQLADNLPAGMVLTGPPVVTVEAGSFETTACSGVAGEAAVRCEFGTVSSGARASVTIPVRILSWTGATVSNTAVVSANNLTYDSDPANNDKTIVVNVQRLTLGGRVFQKADPAQPADPFNAVTDAPIGGIAITVSGADIAGNPVDITRLTEADGSYSFDLPPSDPAGYTVTRGNVPMSVDAAGAHLGSGPATPGAVSAADRSGGIVLDDNGVDYDFWVASNDITLMPPTVSGYVYFDRNRNRVRPSVPDQDPLVQGWTVTLWADLVGGGREEVCRLQTDQYGFYQFDNVRCNAAGYDQWRLTGLPTSGSTPAGYAAAIADFSIEFSSEDGMAGMPQSGGGAGTEQPRSITGITLNPGQNITEQNLPIDPAGVVYDALTRQPVSGAQVFFEDENGVAVAPACLIGGLNPIVTNGSGIYQFLLDTSDPVACAAYIHAAPREYSLRVVPPAGYLPGPSELIPVCANALDVGNPGPFDVQNSDDPPPEAAVQHDPALCPASTAGFNPVNQASTQYYFRFNLTTSGGGASGDVLRNHIPLDPVLGGALRIVKTTPLVNVTKGQAVPYTISATNTLGAALVDVDVVDRMPAGFRYRRGSGSVRQGGGAAFVPVEPAVSGRTLTWTGQDFAAGEVKTYRLVLMVGAGVGEGEYTNHAWAMNSAAGSRISNIGEATVRIIPDPLFDCSDIIGKVFDDRNANGYQDQGEPGIPNVRVVTARGLLITTDAEGRFHVKCADIPQRDRGSNFVIKLDERTLPSGFRVTSENPRDVRVTRGKMVKLNFGASIHKVYRIEVDGRAFGEDDALLPDWAERLAMVVPAMLERPTVARLAYAPGEEGEAVAKRRLKAMERELLRLYREHERTDREEDGRPPLIVEHEVMGAVLRAEGGQQ